MPNARPRLQVLLNRINEWEDEEGWSTTDPAETLLLDIKQCLEDILIYTPHEDLA